MLKVMTGNVHYYIVQSEFTVFIFPEKFINTYLLIKKELYKHFFVLKKKFKILKIPLTNTYKARYLRAPFRMILARLSFKSFFILILLWQHV